MKAKDCSPGDLLTNCTLAAFDQDTIFEVVEHAQGGTIMCCGGHCGLILVWCPKKDKNGLRILDSAGWVAKSKPDKTKLMQHGAIMLLIDDRVQRLEGRW